MRRFSPKRWPRPKSRRWRDEHSPSYGYTDILKEQYSDGWRRPAWARLAHKHGWLTAGEFYAIEASEAGRGITELVYRGSPFFGLLLKRVA